LTPAHSVKNPKML